MSSVQASPKSRTGGIEVPTTTSHKNKVLTSVRVVWLGFVLVLGTLGLGALAVRGASAEELSDVGSVEAEIVNSTVRLGIPGTDEGELRWPSHFPENPEQYEPMPLPLPAPESAGKTNVTQPESRLVSYNLLTGEETVSDVTFEDFALQHWAANGSVGERVGPAEDQVFLKNFTDLTRVTNPASYPWSMNCKTLTTYPGTGAAGASL